jgi:hypothetical protein
LQAIFRPPVAISLDTPVILLKTMAKEEKYGGQDLELAPTDPFSNLCKLIHIGKPFTERKKT